MAYCNQEDIEFVLSEAGVTYSSNDVSDEPDTDNVASAIEKAETKIKQKLRSKYAIDSITRENNAWVKWCAATFAAVILMRRRGNGVPDGLMSDYIEYQGTLDAVSKGQEEIPDLAPRYEPGLTMSNLRVAHWPRSSKIRVVSSISVGQQSSEKPRKTDPFDFPDHY